MWWVDSKRVVAMPKALYASFDEGRRDGDALRLCGLRNRLKPPRPSKVT